MRESSTVYKQGEGLYLCKRQEGRRTGRRKKFKERYGERLHVQQETNMNGEKDEVMEYVNEKTD